MELHKIADGVQIFNTDADVAFMGYKKILYGYQLKIIVAVGRTEQLVDDDYTKGFSEAVMAFANAAHGPVDPDATLTVCINILVGDNIDRSAIKFSKKSRTSKIGQREIPVLYDLNLKKYYTFNWFNIWGLFHAYYYLKTIRKVISFLEENDFKLFKP